MAKSDKAAPADGRGDEGCDALRCGCGALLARFVAGGIELKCRRCKRAVVIAPEPRAPE